MRILVIGSDVSAKTFAALMKHKRGEKVLIDLMSGNNPTIPTTSPSFQSPWIRNDAKGRWIALNFFRDVLGSRKEIIVSKIGIKSTLLSDGKTETFPSFFHLVRNLISFAIEPFRNMNQISITSDMESFLSNRFGARFAKKYTHAISTIFFGSQLISPMFVFPRIFSDCIRGHSVLLSPIRNWFKNEGANNTDYLDHDWQRCVSGGQFIKVDVGNVHAELDGYLKFMGVNRIDRPENFSLERDGKKMELKAEGKSEVYDLVVTSDSPQTVWEYTPAPPSEFDQVAPDYMIRLSRVSKLFSTMIFAKSSNAIRCPILWTPNDPIFGSIVHSHIWDTTNDESTNVEISFFSKTPISAETLALYVESKFPHLTDITIGESNSSECVPSDLSPNRLDGLYAFHKQFRIPVFGSSLQVIGQFYYTPSGSIYDSVSDAKWLVDRIDARYENFPKFIENEQKSDWINRDEKSGFSLTGESSSLTSIVCAV